MQKLLYRESLYLSERDYLFVKNCPYCNGSFLPGSDSYDEMIQGKV